MLWLESPSELEPPKRYRNDYGQLLEHSPVLPARHPDAAIAARRTATAVRSTSTSRPAAG